MKRKLITIPLLILLLLFTSSSFAQVAINDDGSEPNSHAVLDLDVTTKDKGLLIPRLSGSERTTMSLAVADEGLTVYDTDTKTYWLWDGTQWGNFDSSPKHRVGEIFDGGFIFWVDASGEHGLMASLDDLDSGSGIVFSDVTATLIGSIAQSMTSGASNTTAITTQAGHTASAAKLCEDYTGGTHADWYLPSARELSMLFQTDAIMDDVLDNDGDAATNGLNQNFAAPFFSRYWSSSEYDNNEAFVFLSYYGYTQRFTKLSVCGVRAIRKF